MPLHAAVRKESSRRLNLARYERAVLKILKKTGWTNAIVSILLTTDSKIRKTNKRFLGHDYATDVISFGHNAKLKKQKGKEPVFIGDLVISLDTAAAECIEYGNAFSYEVLFYTVHGILHCMGYEDDTPEKSALMLRKQTLILKQTGFDRYSLVN